MAIGKALLTTRVPLVYAPGLPSSCLDGRFFNSLLEFADHDYYVDLLFYHLQIRSYVVIELKAVPFDPGFVGQMNMYLSAVDDLLRHQDDKPTIGLLLCASRDKVVAEYALRDLRKPIGVAEWQTKSTS